MFEFETALDILTEDLKVAGNARDASRAGGGTNSPDRAP